MMRKTHNTVGETFWTMVLPPQAGPGVEMGIHVSHHGFRIGDEFLSWDDIDEARKALSRAPETCTACIDENDCANAPICRAVEPHD